MITDWDVYVAFRAAQARAKSRSYRLPKDWNTFRFTRISEKNYECIKLAMGYFNTKWRNVDLDLFMDYGFELWKGFSYHQFFDKRLIDYYIQKDKIRKRNIRFSKEKIINSLKFIKKFMLDKSSINGYNLIESYCKMREGQKSIVTSHYTKGKIDNLLMTYFIYKKYYVPTDYERKEIFNNIINNYRELLAEMNSVKKLIIKAEEKI